MRVFIQQLDTGLFLRTANEWIQTVDLALSFAGTADAIEYCVMHGMRSVRLVVHDLGTKADSYIHPFDPGERRRWKIPKEDPQRAR